MPLGFSPVRGGSNLKLDNTTRFVADPLGMRSFEELFFGSRGALIAIATTVAKRKKANCVRPIPSSHLFHNLEVSSSK